METFFTLLLLSAGQFVSAAEISPNLKSSVDTRVDLSAIRYQGEVEVEGVPKSPEAARPTIVPTFEDVPYETRQSEPQKTPPSQKNPAEETGKEENTNEINYTERDLAAIRVRLSTGDALKDVVVRGWDPKKKEAIIANAPSITTREELVVYAEALALDDTDITVLRVTDTNIVMSRNETGKFLGFIPVRYTLTATADLGSGTVRAERSWKAKFISKNDAKARLDTATLATLNARSTVQMQAHALATLAGTMKVRHEAFSSAIQNTR